MTATNQYASLVLIDLDWCNMSMIARINAERSPSEEVSQKNGTQHFYS
jgi:hypothetical protein